MVKTIPIGGVNIRLTDKDEVAQGGEAILYKIPPEYVEIFKWYKPATAEYFPDSEIREAVQNRLDILQRKLHDFPKGLPPGIVTPTGFGTNPSGTRIVGYKMRFLDGAVPFWNFSQNEYRDRGGIHPNTVVDYLKSIHNTVMGGHTAGVVFADFNDLNILVFGNDVYYVDADSIQWSNYLSPLYTVKYVDPLLCTWDPKREVPALVNPHNKNSDWYAFCIMVMESMLYSGPYDGNYRPRAASNRIHMNMRSLKRITVWNKEVVYPKFALPWTVLSDDLVAYFLEVFTKDRREDFPFKILENIRWTKCARCGYMHARSVCPKCAQAAPAAIRQKIVQRGNVMATRIFPTSTASGIILIAATQGRNFYYLYHDGESLKREDGSVVSNSPLDTQVRYRVHSKSTLFGKSGRLVVSTPNEPPEVIPVDSYGSLPMFDANANHYYWAANGSLYKNGKLGPEFMGSVLEGQTIFWVGPKFGFGFYRAGEITTGFVFDAEIRSVNDNVSIPVIKGQLLNSTAAFSSERVWFFTTTQIGGKTINTCSVITADGKVEATAQAQSGDGSWLGVITGKCAMGEHLLSSTDDGIVRIEASSGTIAVVKEFPDTEPFVHAGSYLFPHSEGLAAITGKEINILKIT